MTARVALLSLMTHALRATVASPAMSALCYYWYRIVSLDARHKFGQALKSCASLLVTLSIYSPSVQTATQLHKTRRYTSQQQRIDTSTLLIDTATWTTHTGRHKRDTSLVWNYTCTAYFHRDANFRRTTSSDGSHASAGRGEDRLTTASRQVSQPRKEKSTSPLTSRPPGEIRILCKHPARPQSRASSPASAGHRRRSTARLPTSRPAAHRWAWTTHSSPVTRPT